MGRKCTLNFIHLGTDHKTYLRYYCAGKTLNIPIDVILTKQQLVDLNNAVLGGMIQKNCFTIRSKYVTIIETLALKNNHYPTPDEIKEFVNITEKALEIDYLIHQYNATVNVKDSTKKVYNYALNKFAEFSRTAYPDATIRALVQKKTIDDYERYIINKSKLLKTQIASITIHNCKHIVKKFLNFIAVEYNLPQIDYTLHVPVHSGKWHMSEDDIQRLFKHVATTKHQEEVLEILKFNIHIGMRVTDILRMRKDNISFDDDGSAYITFLETKKSNERTVVVVDRTAVNALRRFNGWTIKEKNTFNNVLKSIAKKVYDDEETVLVYKHNNMVDDYVEVKKSDAISSHAIRRYAIARNIVDFGIDVARSLSGHTDYQVITRHYAKFIGKEDLKKKLLKKS